MRRSFVNPNPLRSIRGRQSGSAVLAALAILAVTLVLVSVALSQARHRFRTSHHSSRWSQAEHAAEAGAELALLSAQKSTWTADGWPSAPPAVGAAAIAKTFELSTGVPATGPISATVAVDQVTINSATWLRIRSTGKADVSGGALAGIDPQDVLLRKLSFRRDRSDGTSVTTPRATRTVEILAEPVAKSPFKIPLLLDQKFTMSGGCVDSFDSTDATKSTGGLYDVAKRQSNGDVAINDTQGDSNLGSAFVYGDVTYANNNAPTGTSNVQGTVSTAPDKPISPVVAPTWTTFNATPTDIKTTMTLTGGTQAAPALYKVKSVTVPGGKVLTLAPHAAGAQSYIEIWVTDDMDVSGSGYIQQQAGVHVTYHIEGDVTVSGSGLNSVDNIAANTIVNAVNPAVGKTQKVTVSGSGTFIGAINAPGAAFTISGGASLSGAVIGKTMNISGGGSVHYDEALGRAGGGAGLEYRFASWVEAVR